MREKKRVRRFWDGFSTLVTTYELRHSRKHRKQGKKSEMSSSSSSSSSEEDGNEEWKAAINDIATSTPKPTSIPDPTPSDDDDDSYFLQPQPIKHYQIKAQKVLDDMLEKSLFMVKDSDHVNGNVIEDDRVANGGGVRLFKQAPVGIVFDHQVELQGPKKKPKILPGQQEVDEKSKKFKRKLRCVAVEGADILAAAEQARQKAKARLEAKEAAAKEAAKREEERVAELKKIRGERWLPSMAKQMKLLRPERKV